MPAAGGRRVAIVGGGIGGLTAALALARKGAQVTLFEAAPGPSEFGGGLQITPNGAVVLEALGLGPALDAASIRSSAVVPMDALSGATITRFTLDPGQRWRFLHRRGLARILADAATAAGVTLRYGACVTGADPDGTLGTDEGAARHDLVVGADGLRSTFRTLCGNPDQPPFFTGQVAWRAVVGGLSAAPEARIWMAPGAHVVSYPLTGDRINLVAVQEREAWAEEGWNHPDDPANLRSAFADCCDALKGILAQVDQPRLWGLFRHEVAQSWQAGRLAILGDAAHPTLPFLAQGANLAIEDAWVLATCWADDPAHGLERYQALRRPRVIRAIAGANANARNYHLAGISRPIAHLGLRALGALAPGAFLGRMDWLYRHDVTA